MTRLRRREKTRKYKSPIDPCGSTTNNNKAQWCFGRPGSLCFLLLLPSSRHPMQVCTVCIFIPPRRTNYSRLWSFCKRLSPLNWVKRIRPITSWERFFATWPPFRGPMLITPNNKSDFHKRTKILNILVLKNHPVTLIFPRLSSHFSHFEWDQTFQYPIAWQQSSKWGAFAEKSRNTH